jgi:deazaflavin-dependent oxidoreductase (nitroreductase family)
MSRDLGPVADEQHAYVTTVGRATGSPHEIEIWFATDATTIFLISGGAERSDWVRNLLNHPHATVRITDQQQSYTARFELSAAERRFAADELARKYRPGSADDWIDGYLIALDPIALDPNELRP